MSSSKLVGGSFSTLRDILDGYKNSRDQQQASYESAKRFARRLSGGDAFHSLFVGNRFKKQKKEYINMLERRVGEEHASYLMSAIKNKEKNIVESTLSHIEKTMQRLPHTSKETKIIIIPDTSSILLDNFLKSLCPTDQQTNRKLSANQQIIMPYLSKYLDKENCVKRKPVPLPTSLRRNSTSSSDTKIASSNKSQTSFTNFSRKFPTRSTNTSIA